MVVEELWDFSSHTRLVASSQAQAEGQAYIDWLVRTGRILYEDRKSEKAWNDYLEAAQRGDFWAAIKAGLRMDGYLWKEAFDSPEHTLFTIVSFAPGAGVEGNLARSERSAVWELGLADRGLAIETRLGANTPKGFPTIDRWINGVATSIKSLDLTAKTYQNVAALTRRINGYVDKLWAFEGEEFGGLVIAESAIVSRELILVVPSGIQTAAQTRAIIEADKRAKAIGINLVIDDL